jgi:Tfp pilus assembly protein PilV
MQNYLIALVLYAVGMTGIAGFALGKLSGRR